MLTQGVATDERAKASDERTCGWKIAARDIMTMVRVVVHSNRGSLRHRWICEKLGWYPREEKWFQSGATLSSEYTGLTRESENHDHVTALLTVTGGKRSSIW